MVTTPCCCRVLHVLHLYLYAVMAVQLHHWHHHHHTLSDCSLSIHHYHCNAITSIYLPALHPRYHLSSLSVPLAASSRENCGEYYILLLSVIMFYIVILKHSILAHYIRIILSLHYRRNLQMLRLIVSRSKLQQQRRQAGSLPPNLLLRAQQ